MLEEQDFDKSNGNYLMIYGEYCGEDKGSLLRADDEYTDVVIRLGCMEDDVFIEKYRYKFKIREGGHKYAIRISSDYYWYCENINAVSIECENPLYNVDIKLLEGD